MWVAACAWITVNKYDVTSLLPLSVVMHVY